MKKLLMPLVAFAMVTGYVVAQEEITDSPRWYVNPGVGMLFPQGGQAIDVGLNLSLRAGYELTDHWSAEGEFSIAPNMTDAGGWSQSGQQVYGVGADMLYHFRPYSRFDPFLSGGWAVYMANRPVFNKGKHRGMTGPRAGIGAMYHLTDNLSLRTDARAMMSVHSRTPMQYTWDAGVVYRFGGGGGSLSSSGFDADASLPKSVQAAEKFKKEADPDDMMVFEVYINFDYDATVIKPQYFNEIDQILRVLEMKPEAIALIEGHADRRLRSSASYNQDLSERRAHAVLSYMVGKGIASSRLIAAGYGFSRPKVEPDLVNGNPENRRVEIYIRGAGSNADKGKYSAK